MKKKEILIKFLDKIEKRKKIKVLLIKIKKLRPEEIEDREKEMERRREILMKKQREIEFQKLYENEMNKRRNRIEQGEKES